MTTVEELMPGDRVVHAEDSAIFVARTTHPIWPHLQLVVWRMEDRSWSHDALSAHQEIFGTVEQASADERMLRLRRALLGGGS